MSHYYKINNNGSVALLESVTTPAQARKHGSALVSVTTVLSLLPNDFINNTWKPQQYVKIARENARLTTSEIKDKMWGERTCPETGKTISSSDFGTRAHARIEDRLNGCTKPHPYDAVTTPTIDFLEKNGFTAIQLERMIACKVLGVAGTIDGVGEKNGKIVLWDYKFRDCNGSGKTYDKDCAQLAIEAKMVMEQDGLDYIPEIYSICVDANTGIPYVKKWTHKAARKGIANFMACRNFYYALPSLGGSYE